MRRLLLPFFSFHSPRVNVAYDDVTAMIRGVEDGDASPPLLPAACAFRAYMEFQMGRTQSAARDTVLKGTTLI
jgi:hypothetical protein